MTTSIGAGGLTLPTGEIIRSQLMSGWPRKEFNTLIEKSGIDPTTAIVLFDDYWNDKGELSSTGTIQTGNSDWGGLLGLPSARPDSNPPIIKPGTAVSLAAAARFKTRTPSAGAYAVCELNGNAETDFILFGMENSLSTTKYVVSWRRNNGTADTLLSTVNVTNAFHDLRVVYNATDGKVYFQVDTEAWQEMTPTSGRWPDGTLTLRWGPYANTSNSDILDKALVIGSAGP